MRTSVLVLFLPMKHSSSGESDFCDFKGTNARRCYENLRREAASLKIQTCYRMHCARKNYVDLCTASTTIQSGLRGMAARKEHHFRQQTKAAVIIQVCFQVSFLVSFVSNFQPSSQSLIFVCVIVWITLLGQPNSNYVGLFFVFIFNY